MSEFEFSNNLDPFIKRLKLSLKFDAIFIKTIFFMYLYNLIPNLFTFKRIKIFLMRLAGAKTGAFYAKSPFYVDRADLLKLGDGIFINIGVQIGGNAHIEIGDGCHIGPGCIFATTNHREEYSEELPIKIGKNVWLGAGCIVLPGTVITDDVVCSAGSVVKGNIDKPGLWAGSPAKRKDVPK